MPGPNANNPNLFDGEIYPFPVRFALFMGDIEPLDVDDPGELGPVNSEFAQEMGALLSHADQFDFI
jgi:hypothetical protein